MKTTTSVRLKALRAAFPHTIPILTGFLFLGITYGIYMDVSGFPAVWSIPISLTVFAGSMQFVLCNMLLGAFNPLQAFVMTLMINARHLFYGISMLDRYRGMGRKRGYLIFGLIDETFSVAYAAPVPEGVDDSWFCLWITILHQVYWVGGTALGALFGMFLNFNTEGLDFVMTAMFVVILLEQWLKERNHTATLLGLGLSVLCLVVFGADGFIIPAMLAILGVLSLLRAPLEKGGALQ